MAAAPLPDELRAWLARHAQALDQGGPDAPSDEVIARLGRAGLLRIGVPRQHAGAGGDVADAVDAIAAVAAHSLAAAFMFWGQRAFVEYLLDSPNAALRERRLHALLAGEHAGATGLSNAMKFLGGIEALQVQATPHAGGWRLDGSLPWVTNLAPTGFVVAAAVSRPDGAPMVVALPSDRPGVQRSADLDLLALRGSRTAALELRGVHIDEGDLLHADAGAFLPQVRPAFLGLQCGLSIGLAQAAGAAARAACDGRRHVLQPRLDELDAALAQAVDAMRAGLRERSFVHQAAPLFRLRLRLADLVQEAVQLELQACGGKAYLGGPGAAFGRRWREAAFVPVVTPSLTQLHGELQKHAAAVAARPA